MCKWELLWLCQHHVLSSIYWTQVSHELSAQLAPWSATWSQESSLLGHTDARYPCLMNGPSVGKKPHTTEMSIFLHQPEMILGWANSWFGSLTQCTRLQERQLMALYLGFFICSTKCSEVPHWEGDIFRLWCSTAKCCCWLCLTKSGWLDAHSASYCRGNAVLKYFSVLQENSLTGEFSLKY